MRFFMVSQARSGTHMIRSVLRVHPSVTMWYDFHADLVGHPGALPAFLEAEYTKYSQESCVGGFTHFIGVDINENYETWEDNWAHFNRLQDRVIVVTRTNTLSRYLSILIAESTNKWDCDSPRTSNQRIELNLQAYLEHLEFFRRNDRKIMGWIYPYLAVTYEELVNDWDCTIRKVYDYVGLEWNDPKPTTHKQEVRSVKDIVSNWDQIVSEALALPPDDVSAKLLLELNS